MLYYDYIHRLETIEVRILCGGTLCGIYSYRSIYSRRFSSKIYLYLDNDNYLSINKKLITFHEV